MIFALSEELQHFGGATFRRKPQETAEVRRKPQNLAETRLSHLVCPLVPFHTLGTPPDLCLPPCVFRD